MAVTKKPEKFVSRGVEFATKKAAERYEELCSARDALDNAQRVFQRTLGQSCLTKDGVPFEFSVWRDYCYVVVPYNQRPYIIKVSFMCFNWEVSERVGDDGEAVVEIKTELNGRPFKCKISELYAVEANAVEAMREATRRWIEEETRLLEGSDAKGGK